MVESITISFKEKLDLQAEFVEWLKFNKIYNEYATAKEMRAMGKVWRVVTGKI